jgi:rubrerythrin
VITEHDLAEHLDEIRKLESRMKDIYRQLAEGVSDPDLKATFTALMEAEHSHHSLVDGLMDDLAAPRSRRGRPGSA